MSPSKESKEFREDNDVTTLMYKNSKGRVLHKPIFIQEAIEMYKNDPKAIYSDIFFGEMQNCKNWQIEVGKRIPKFFNKRFITVNSFADLGCGNAYYLQGMFESGFSDLYGLEYCLENALPYIDEKIRPFVHYGDLMEPMNLKRSYDLTICVEVAEHTLPEKTEIFVENIDKITEKALIFSSAGSPLKGTGHINCKEFSFWKNLFKECGLIYSKGLTKEFRKEMYVEEYVTRYQKFMLKNFAVFSRR